MAKANEKKKKKKQRKSKEIDDDDANQIKPHFNIYEFFTGKIYMFIHFWILFTHYM